MNRVTYKNFTFQDADLTLYSGGSAILHFSPLGGELETDTFKIPVIFEPAEWEVEAESFKADWQRGEEVNIYEDNTLLYRFYLTDITGGQKLRQGQYLFYLEGVSFCGLYVDRPHGGDYYTAKQAGDLIAEILGATYVSTTNGTRSYITSDGITYHIPDNLATKAITGCLFYSEDARSNLKLALQSIGARPSVEADGTPSFTMEWPISPVSVETTDIYMGDKYKSDRKIKTVRVIEHSYYKDPSMGDELLYDGTGENLQNALVTFEAPYYGYTTNGTLTISESSATYAVISGTGELYGKPFVTATRQIEADTGISGAEAVKVLDNPLCNSLNSDSLLNSMRNFYSAAAQVDNAFVLNEEEIGGLIEFNDPLGQTKLGYLKKMALAFSGITKSTNEIITDWVPQRAAFYSETVILDRNQTWNVPDGVTRIRFFIMQGGKGGYGGYQGQSGSGLRTDEAGEGGEVGEGGSAGKVLVVTIDTPANSYTVTVGAAGLAGGIDHGEGTEGGHSTLSDGTTTWTSADGTIPAYGLVNPLNGDTYAMQGRNGIYKGTHGVDSRHTGESITDTETSQTGTTTTWTQGTDITSAKGGGAAYGANGQNAYLSSSSGQAEYNAGDGADAVLDGFNGYVYQEPSYGTGGIGGNGGGGGGSILNLERGWEGAGGHGSKGGNAGKGAVIAFLAYGTLPPIPEYPDLMDVNGEQLYDVYFERLQAQEQI